MPAELVRGSYLVEHRHYIIRSLLHIADENRRSLPAKQTGCSQTGAGGSEDRICFVVAGHGLLTLFLDPVSRLFDSGPGETHAMRLYIIVGLA